MNRAPKLFAVTFVICCLMPVLVTATTLYESRPRETNVVYYDMGAESQYDLAPAAGSTPEYWFYLWLDENTQFNPTSYTARLHFSDEEDVDNVSGTDFVTGTCYSNYVVFSFSTNDLQTSWEEGYSAITLTSGTEVHTFCRGVLTSLVAPEIGGTNVFAGTTAINWAEYGPHTSVLTSFVLLAGSNMTTRAVGTNGQYYLDVTLPATNRIAEASKTISDTLPIGVTPTNIPAWHSVRSDSGYAVSATNMVVTNAGSYTLTFTGAIGLPAAATYFAEFFTNGVQAVDAGGNDIEAVALNVIGGFTKRLHTTRTITLGANTDCEWRMRCATAGTVTFYDAVWRIESN